MHGYRISPNVEHCRRATRHRRWQSTPPPSCFSVVLPASWLGSSRRGTGGDLKRLGGRHGSQNYSLTRMDAGVNNSEIVSERAKSKGQPTETTRWSDDGIDGGSDIELASNGAAPDGIQMWKDFRVECTK